MTAEHKTTRLNLGNYYGRVELIMIGDVTYLALRNWDGTAGIALTPDEAMVAQALFGSIGPRAAVENILGEED